MVTAMATRSISFYREASHGGVVIITHKPSHEWLQPGCGTHMVPVTEVVLGGQRMTFKVIMRKHDSNSLPVLGVGVCRLFRVRQIIGYQMKTRKNNQRISLLVIIITIIPYISSIFIVFQVLFKFFIYPVNSVDSKP